MALVALTASAFALCLYHLGARSIWVDEGASLSIASQNGVSLFRGIAHDGGNQALYYLALHIVISLFGRGEVALRIFSALSSAAVVPLTYGLGRRLVSPATGLLAALLAAFCEPLVYWGQMARGYTLVAALAAASGWAFVAAARSGRPRDHALWVLATLAMCYAGLPAIALVVVELLVVALWWRHLVRPRYVLAGAGLVVLGCLPLGLLETSRGSSQLFWLDPPTPRTVEAALRFLIGSDVASAGHWESSVLTVSTLVVVGLAVVVIPFDVAARRRTDYEASLLLVLWLALPLATLYVVSVSVHPVFLDRYFSASLPAEFTLVAALLSRVRPAALAGALCVALVALRVTQIPPSYSMVRDNWRGATAFVARASEPGDCIAFDANDGWIDFNYYLTRAGGEAEIRSAPRPVLPSIGFGSDPLIVESYDVLSERQIGTLAPNCRRVWVVDSHAGTSGDSLLSVHVRAQLATMLSDLHSRYPHQSETRFTYITLYLDSSG